MSMFGDASVVLGRTTKCCQVKRGTDDYVLVNQYGVYLSLTTVKVSAQLVKAIHRGR